MASNHGETAVQKLTRADLYSLEQYAQLRADFRKQVIEHKKNRVVRVGPNAALYFEDRLTMQYQVQEMLRAERIFEAAGIAEELDAYNPLIPDGSNWKATFMLEYPDIEMRRVALERLKGVERRVWVRVAGFEPVWAIADEDLPRENDAKTSSVHFMRFELSAPMLRAMAHGADVAAGIDHAEYRHAVDPLPRPTRDALAKDLNL